MLVVAPTGILAAGYNSITFFTTFGIGTENYSREIPQTKKEEMIESFKYVRTLFVDEA